LAQAQAAFGRVEQVEVNGRKLYLLLIKNPAGFTQVLETFLMGKESSSVMFAINDLTADGRDVSWLWDVPLELIAPAEPRVIVSGIRAADMALRLHYAGIESKREDRFEQALNQLLKNTEEGEVAYIMPTYTAMIALRKALSKITHIPEAGV
jgi:UDP-N-acetylmuramyl tripeptide synthase